MTTRLVLVALALATSFVAGGIAHAFVRTTTQSSVPPCPDGQARPLYWNQVTIPYYVDSAGTPDVTEPPPAQSAFDALLEGFKAWQDVSCSYIAFEYQGLKVNAPVGFTNGQANINVVKWIESGWTQNRTAIAVTLTTYDCNSGQIFDADITLNGENFKFATDGRAIASADVQNTVTHEVGHFIGFDHDTDSESTMFAMAPLGETRKRTLAQTDVDGACFVYQVGKEPKPNTGCAVAAPGSGGDRALGAGLVPLLLGLFAILAGLFGARRLRALRGSGLGGRGPRE